MKISFDGQTFPGNIITLTSVPNILTIESGTVQGSKSELLITVNNLASLDLTKEYTITVNDVTIHSTAGKAANKQFYITNGNSEGDKIAVASSITRALRNTSLVNYEIYQGNTNGIMDNTVHVIAREVGEQYAISFSSNLGRAITSAVYEGSSTDEFIGNKINVDIYSNNDYITTLEKSYYKERIDFNISQVLSTISRYNFLTPYKLIIYSDNGTSVRSIGQISGLQSAIGYMCNQGLKYIPIGDNVLAQNVSRGTQTGVYNKTVLYTYQPTIPISIYTGGRAAIVAEIHYLGSNREVFRQDNTTIPVYSNYGYSEIALDSQYFNQAYYVDIVIPDIGTVRYNVIKPVDATGRCQRVYYHNSYGGVSFFDFTGQITENHKVDNDTYTKNIFNYYEDQSMEQTKIYGKETSITVTMKSHLMERSAVWQFNDLLGSYDVWTNINGVDYKIIITDCKVDESETGVWEATITYTYSLI